MLGSLIAVRQPKLRAFVDATFAEVRTANDLRGLAMMIGRAANEIRIDAARC